ncbi:MAG: putative thioredoxin [Alphaproteobacteria bacterium]|jgi:putative thioredoxin
MNTILGGPGGSGMGGNDGMGGGPGSSPGGGGPSGAAPAVDSGALIQDVTTQSFMVDVIEASKTVPVIVDFWAPWCGPCKQLGPILEKLVTAAGGKVRLAKVDIDQNQALAGQLRIQSIPMVYAFFNGQPVDGFSGAVPESQIQAFIDKLITAAGNVPGQDAGPDIAQMIKDGRAALSSGDEGGALAQFSAVLEVDEKNVDALAGLARCYVAAGETDAAKAILDDLPTEAQKHTEVEAARAALDLAAAGAAAGDANALESKVAAEPDNFEARFDLAMAHFAANRREQAVDHLIDIVRKKRDWNDGAARLQLVKMFEAWGAEDPLTIESRQRLSTILFA